MGTTVNDVYTPLFDDNVNISFHVFVKKAIRTFDPFFSTTGMRALFDEVDYDALKNTHFLPKDGQLESEPTLVTEESTHVNMCVTMLKYANAFAREGVGRTAFLVAKNPPGLVANTSLLACISPRTKER